MPSNVTHRFVSPILWKLNQPLYSSAIQHVFAVAVVYTHRSVPPRYGFMTQHDKSHLNSYITTRLEEARIKDYICAELIMSSIRQDTVLYNPGIIGSGILGTNLSQKSNTAILDYSDILVRLYQYAKYKDHDGSLYRDIIGNPPET